MSAEHRLHAQGDDLFRGLELPAFFRPELIIAVVRSVRGVPLLHPTRRMKVGKVHLPGGVVDRGLWTIA